MGKRCSGARRGRQGLANGRERRRWQRPIPSRICAVRLNTSDNLWARLSNARRKQLLSGPEGDRWRAATSMPDITQKVSIQVRVNGKPHSRAVEPRCLLVEFLREDLELTGTHIGCDTTYCGACTVLMNAAA